MELEYLKKSKLIPILLLFLNNYIFCKMLQCLFPNWEKSISQYKEFTEPGTVFFNNFSIYIAHPKAILFWIFFIVMFFFMLMFIVSKGIFLFVIAKISKLKLKLYPSLALVIYISSIIIVGGLVVQIVRHLILNEPFCSYHHFDMNWIDSSIRELIMDALEIFLLFQGIKYFMDIKYLPEMRTKVIATSLWVVFIGKIYPHLFSLLNVAHHSVKITG